MKCEIIKDLLPAYCDCVCSVETAAEIESHTQNCPDCRKLLENYRIDALPLNKSEPEKPFRRIKRGIFRSKLTAAFLIIILAAVLCIGGYLTYGQIVREPNIPSFETIISSQKAKNLVKKICRGDIDSAMKDIDLYQTGVALLDNQNEIREHCRTTLTNFYEKYLKGRDLNVKTDQYCGYGQFPYEVGLVTTSDVNIYDGKAKLLTFNLVEYRSNGKFILGISSWSDNLGDGCDKSIDALNLALEPIEPTPIIETAIINNVTKRTQNFGLLAHRFAETDEEKRTLNENALSLIEDMYCESAYYTDFRFDAENSRYLVDIGFIFREKSSGKRVAYSRTIRLRSASYQFEILPEFEPVIIDDGISKENLEKLKNLFVY